MTLEYKGLVDRWSSKFVDLLARRGVQCPHQLLPPAPSEATKLKSW